MDWVRFLDENNVHYVTRGPNTKRGEVSIQCPMCGDDDPSEHLGVNLTTGKWGCHRDQSHRGKSSRTLVKAILGCSSQQAGFIVRQYSGSDPDTLDGVLATLEADHKGHIVESNLGVAEKARHQALGPQFRDFYDIRPRGITKRFFQYLMDRGYDNPEDVIENFDLKCALTGRYKDRIIIPVKLHGDLFGWTSRAIVDPRNAPRYLASNEDVKTTVLNYDNLKEGGKRLFIVEGPFDAIRMDSYRHGDVPFRATCTFGTSVSVSQYALLRKLVKSYDEAYVLFDQGADGPAEDLAQWVGAKKAYLPASIKDPGELSPVALKGFGNEDYTGSPFDLYERATDPLYGSFFSTGNFLTSIGSKRRVKV